MDHVTGAARSEDVRAHNLAAVMAHLDLVGRASRAELSATTGLVSGAVSSLVQELRDARLVRPAGASEPGAGPRPPRRGRPTEIVEIDGSDLGFLVVQFLMGQVRVVGTDLAGRSLHDRTLALSTPVGDPAALADVLVAPTVAGLAGLRAAGARPVALAVVAPAPVDPTSGHVAFSVDFGWRDVDLAALLRDRLPDPPGRVMVLNDAQTATHAETVAQRRAGGPADDLVYLKADTGIGGGVVVAGRLLRGTTAFVFQPGHVVTVPGGPACTCGKRGCLVTVAGPDVLLRAAGLDGLAADAGFPAALDELFARHDAGDATTVGAVRENAAWLRLALVNVCVLLQPRVVVLGGYLARVRDLLLDEGDDGLGPAGLPGAPQVIAARHGADSALQGALSLCRGTVLASPGQVRAT
ncbi:ROK family protein [Jannaschia sp. R86511]|uniref:ROK family protein n=1 Tax=Jannaschia sp. R86511 TaxID=3093853 RepID=UPI0036D2D3F9